MKGSYVIEFKTMASPYHYEYLRHNDGTFRAFKSIVDARKICISIIDKRKAVVAVIRGLNTEQIVYTTAKGGYVVENRQTSRNYWNRLNKNGTLGAYIPHTDVKKMGIIQSASQRW